MASAAAVDAAISLAFMDMALQIHFSYDDWEAGFVRRWHLPPRSNRRALEYLRQHSLRRDWLTIVEAARAFHTNDFTIPPEKLHLLAAMEKDFDRVPPDLAEPPLNNQDWERVEQQQDDFDPRNPRRRGRVIFDMQGGVKRDPA